MRNALRIIGFAFLVAMFLHIIYEYQKKLADYHIRLGVEAGLEHCMKPGAYTLPEGDIRTENFEPVEAIRERTSKQDT